jgi:hypothetical protein
MANNNLTIFQRLNNVFRGTGRDNISPDIITTPPGMGAESSRVLFTTSDKNEYERKLNTYKQQKYLAYQWKKVGADNAMESLAGYTAVKLMYRDVDLMDGSPEIGTALDIISEEVCPIKSDGKMINVYSSSKRTKAMLEDLFVNRLHIYTDLPMIARHLAKYGNTFMFLNIDKDNGIMGWTMLPVYEIDRIENGFSASYAISSTINNKDVKPDTVRFVWNGHNENNPFWNWQVAHFRLLNDSFFLPYGVSMMHKARRAWRMWSMMEDAMLIWRLDKAVERRVYKIYVGNINDADVESYVQEIANNFKRTPIIDPATGQIDLRRNFLDVASDYFIPVRREDAPNPIETLAAANSQVQMEDIEYMQNKMFAAMRVPKTFLNFQEAQGKGQNLSIMDVRFSRMINRIQQFLLMELNKIAMIHLYVMGLTDEIGNFTISLNNPSAQIEAQELDDLTKRLTAMQTALADPGTGIPMMSMHKALKEIMKMSDSEIKDMLLEIRFEKAMAAELAATANIIKKTGMFDNVDRIYGDYEAMNGGGQAQQQGEGEEDGLGGGGGGLGGGLGGDLGGDMEMDLGEPGAEEGSDLGGEMGETDMGGAPQADAGEPLMEARKRKLPKLTENKNKSYKSVKSFTQRYFDLLSENSKETEPVVKEVVDFLGKTATMEGKIKQVCSNIDKLVNESEMENDDLINEAVSALSMDDSYISIEDEGTDELI